MIKTHKQAFAYESDDIKVFESKAKMFAYECLSKYPNMVIREVVMGPIRDHVVYDPMSGIFGGTRQDGYCVTVSVILSDQELPKIEVTRL